MKKLLHERLREWADSTEGDKYPSTKMLYATIESDHAPLGADDERKAFHLLADEIEKYYIPRPRFEDGEPVQFGDYVDGCNGPVDSFLIYEDGSGTVYGDADLPYKVDDGAVTHIDEPHKRPKPKVPDADGLETKVGDTVWSLKDSTKWEVTETHPIEPRISLRQLDTEKEVEGGWFLSSEYSHREPDSLEKVQDTIDALANVYESDDRLCDDLHNISDRLTALIERGA